MDSFDVVIVGGGPAGSSCAWKLRDSGLKVAILDRQPFPRHKVCGGWITPAVLDALDIDAAEYAVGRVFQPITGFRIGCLGGRQVETHYSHAVSYGIRRFEFDDYLLKRSGAALYCGAADLERRGGEWTIGGRLRAPMLVGAGGTFCPAARLLGAKLSDEAVVAAQEAEFEIAPELECQVQGTVPELYFCPDMKGYGWLFRKQRFLNVGLGRLDPHGLSGHVSEFLKFLKSSGKLLNTARLSGHAYLVYGVSPRQITGDGVLLIGDAAGLAYAGSGEGIRPAIESGLMAARVIEDAQGRYSEGRLQPYRARLLERFGKPGDGLLSQIGRRLPEGLAAAMARKLMPAEWFARSVVLDRWFLRSDMPALSV